MESQSFIAADVSDLTTVADWFWKTHPRPVVVVFDAGMGAGKTTLIQALCAAKGAAAMGSPTFSIVNEYHGGDYPIYHFDLYRLEHTHQALDIGFEDYLDQEAYLFIEWPAVVLPLLPAAIRCQIEDHDGVRHIRFGAWSGVQ
jgi:tRNA threonylcarbamoyladenosine biosynthesis protein TsaE